MANRSQSEMLLMPTLSSTLRAASWISLSRQMAPCRQIMRNWTRDRHHAYIHRQLVIRLHMYNLSPYYTPIMKISFPGIYSTFIYPNLPFLRRSTGVHILRWKQCTRFSTNHITTTRKHPTSTDVEDCIALVFPRGVLLSLSIGLGIYLAFDIGACLYIRTTFIQGSTQVNWTNIRKYE